ncbi:serine hydrolase domain-containing protein [Rhabdobacter roseus]|uniref:CubicO group peptidase (Beta-lactamase class C family) n=1 Tax=Rhabdobacter roseus TaxID=1655419 RepID=A0A840TSP5_9BACT|nr:serine hydrolase domain-containing protein [Rhabdobacter roseus]MBB5284592.1 CubicO group peptidase (beta-lactamase class C family) [Rhabdobacter roseus]
MRFSFFKKVLFTGLGTLAFLWAQGQATVTDPAYIRDFLRRVSAESGAPGVSAAVAVGGQLIFSDGIGYADLDNLIPQTGKTVHNIGSVSKAEAVVAIMQLEEKGLLSLDDEIQKYLPYMPRKQKPVTIRHLLTHTSGIRHYATQDNEAFGTKRMRPYDTFEEATTLFRDDPLLFEPGAYYHYSSFACNLMHGIVEKVSGLDFEEYMKRHVWLPAGMLTSSFDVPARLVPHRGKGYVRAANGILINAPYEDVSYKYAGGGIISTAEDMVKLGVALNRGLLLKPATLKKMTTPYFNKYEKAFRGTSNPTQVPQWQGLVWFVGQDQRGRSWYGHSGTVKGTRCFLINFPAEAVVVAIQANIGSIAIDEYALALAQLILADLTPVSTSK